jgi:hypothetical protein
VASIADVRKIALGFPETVEKPCHGTPGFYVRKHLFARVLDDAQVVVHVDFDQRDALLETEPETFHVTPHYMTEPWVIVRLGAIERGRLDDLLFEAWRQCAPPALSRHPAGSRPKRPVTRR